MAETITGTLAPARVPARSREPSLKAPPSCKFADAVKIQTASGLLGRSKTGGTIVALGPPFFRRTEDTEGSSMTEMSDSFARPTLAGAPAAAPRAMPKDAAHPFAGRHLVVSYLGCDVGALSDHRGLVSAMRSAVKASGAELLKTSEHVFSEGGFTAVMLLSESHASVHTYPEFAACFVDLFTCGYNCKGEKFDEVLRAYLRPQEVAIKTFLRSNDVVDDLAGQDSRPSPRPPVPEPARAP